MTEDCKIIALEAQIEALARLVDSREEWNKERISNVEKNISLAFAVSEKAVDKAEAANERRFNSVNEFRSALSDQTATLLPKSEYSVQHEALQTALNLAVERLIALEKSVLPRKEFEGLHRALGARVQADTDRVNSIMINLDTKRQGLGLIGQFALGIITAIAAAAAVITATLHH